MKFSSKHLRWRFLILTLIALYLLGAYVFAPKLDERSARRHADFSNLSEITRTGTGLPGDPLNISLIGSENELIRSLTAAGWTPANALGLRSSARIVLDTVIDKPDAAAPVSNLYLFGRKEDLAFEKPIGHSPRERHHARFWKSQETEDGRAVWMGAATQDNGVELSHTTGQVTHHISPDVDAERALLIADLIAADQISATRWLADFHQVLQGRNGEGDPWHSDGRLPVVTLKSAETPARAADAR